jgi:hypothetical protein
MSNEPRQYFIALESLSAFLVLKAVPNKLCSSVPHENERNCGNSVGDRREWNFFLLKFVDNPDFFGQEPQIRLMALYPDSP